MSVCAGAGAELLASRGGKSAHRLQTAHTVPKGILSPLRVCVCVCVYVCKEEKVRFRFACRQMRSE